MSKKVEQQGEDSVQADLARLSEMIAWFQSDEFTLEQAVPMYKEAEAVAEKIEGDLSALKNEITIIKQKFDQA